MISVIYTDDFSGTDVLIALYFSQTRAQVVPSQGVWDMRGKQLYQGIQIRVWAIACFAPQRAVGEEALRYSRVTLTVKHSSTHTTIITVMISDSGTNVHYQRFTFTDSFLVETSPSSYSASPMMPVCQSLGSRVSANMPLDLTKLNRCSDI